MPGWLLSERRDSGPKPDVTQPRTGQIDGWTPHWVERCSAIRVRFLERFFLLRGFPNEGF